jgi:Bacterial Ig-like domain (group 3)
MKAMPGPHRRILLPLLPFLFLSLAGCMGGSGGSGLQNKESANVSVEASSVSVTEGQPVTLEAYVNPTLATGTVTFYSGSTAIGTAALNSSGFSTTGIALLGTSFSSVGPHSITAQYNGNDFYSAGTSAAMSIGVYNAQLASSSITLQASTTTPPYLTGVTLTAAVAPSSATGTVTFYNGSTNIGSAAVSGGSASLVTSFAAGGTTTLHAVYSGDYNYLSSTSNSLAMNVSGPLVTTTNLKASTNATAIGGSVTLTAALTPATATGAVTFYNGSTQIGTANVTTGVATLTTTFSVPGNTVLKAVFAASAAWETSTSNQVSLFVSGNTPSTVLLQAAPSSLVIGYSSTLTATVSPVVASGTVVLYDGTRAIDVTSVAGGTAVFVDTFLTAGPQSLTAVYSGDTTYVSSTSSPFILNVSNPGSAPTTTTLTLSEYSGYTGDSVTLRVNVNPSAATGQVDLYQNGTLLQSVVLSGGTAAWSQVFSQGGTITAVYNGDTTYSPSTSSPQSLQLSDPTPPTPSCPTDPTLCQIFCPGSPTCP